MTHKVFAVVDANSAYWTPEGESDYDRATFVRAGSPDEACAKARENGFDGLLFAIAMRGTKYEGAITS